MSARPADRCDSPRSARRASGLTLLEVLAAFLIFSMVFTVLVGTSQRGVKSQGVSARRLLANEIADRQLAELEAPMVRHGLPGIPEDEFQEEDFTIRIAMSPIGGDASNPSAPGLSSAIGDLGGGGDGLAALAAQIPEVAKYLRRYDVEVEWPEGAGVQSLRRTTFAFDWPGAAAEYAALFAQGGAAGFAALAGTAAGAAGDPTAAGASGTGTDGSAGDRGRGAGTGADSELQQIIRNFCSDPQNAAQAPEVCGGR